MRLILMFALATAAFRVDAIECGPTIHVVALDHLSEAVSDANARLSQHSVSLIEEQVRAADNELLYGKISLEHTYVESVISAGTRLENPLRTAWLLGQIRNEMLDSRDKRKVGEYLSLHLTHVHQTSKLALQSISSTLVKLSRPGIAIDVAKLRDSIETVVRDLSKCSAPARRSDR